MLPATRRAVAQRMKGPASSLHRINAIGRRSDSCTTVLGGVLLATHNDAFAFSATLPPPPSLSRRTDLPAEAQPQRWAESARNNENLDRHRVIGILVRALNRHTPSTAPKVGTGEGTATRREHVHL